jgi:hypothetical protein
MPFTSTTNMIIIGPRHELNEVFHSASGYAGGARAEYTFNNPGGLFSLSASGKLNSSNEGVAGSPSTGWNSPTLGTVVYGSESNAGINFTPYDYTVSGNKAGFIYGPTVPANTLLINQTGSRHNQLFWAYYGSGSTGNDPATWSTNAKNFLSGSKNLAYNIFTGRTAPDGIFLGPFLVNQADGSSVPRYTGSRLIPVINGGYEYSASAQLASGLITDGFFRLAGDNTKQTLRFSTPSLDTLRLDSTSTFGNTPNGQYAGQFNPLTSSYFQTTRGTAGTGSYNFFRGPVFPIANYICGEMPVFITMSFTSCRSSGNPGSNTHLQLNIYKTEEGAAPTLLTSSFGSVPNSGTPGTVIISASITPRSGSLNSQVGLSTWQSAYRQGIIFELQNTSTGPPFAISCSQITTSIEQPFGPGRQHYHHIYWDSGSSPFDYPVTNNTGAYYVITPYLSGSDNILVPGAPASWQIPADASSFAVMNFTHRVYYFKSALDLWRNAWQVQGIDGLPFCTQAEWISASTNPTWAASASGYITTGIPWTASSNGSERMAAYVGITAELLGGSLTSLKLKSTQNGLTGSAAFSKGGGMIVVRANNAAATINNDPDNINFQLQDPNSATGAAGQYPMGGVVSFRSKPALYTDADDYDWPVNYNWPSANPYAGPPGL